MSSVRERWSAIINYDEWKEEMRVDTENVMENPEEYGEEVDLNYGDDEYNNFLSSEYVREEEEEFTSYKDYIIPKEDLDDYSDEEEEEKNIFNLKYLLNNRYSRQIEQLEFDYILKNLQDKKVLKTLESFKTYELILLFLYEVSLKDDLIFSDDYPDNIYVIKKTIFDKDIYEPLKDINPEDESLITTYFPNSTQKWFGTNIDIERKLFLKTIMKNISVMFQDHGYNFSVIPKNIIQKYLKLNKEDIILLKSIDKKKLIYLPLFIITYYIPEYLIELRNLKKKYFGSNEQQLRILTNIYSNIESAHNLLDSDLYDNLMNIQKEIKHNKEELSEDNSLSYLTSEGKKRKREENNYEMTDMYDVEEINILKDDMEGIIITEKNSEAIDEYKKFIDNYEDNYDDVVITDKDSLKLLMKEYNDKKHFLFDIFSEYIEDNLNSKIIEKIIDIDTKINKAEKLNNLEKHISDYLDSKLEAYGKIENILKHKSMDDNKKKLLHDDLKNEKENVLTFFKNNIDDKIKYQIYDETNQELKKDEIKYFLVSVIKILYNKHAYVFLMNKFDKDIFKNKSVFDEKITQSKQDYELLKKLKVLDEEKKYNILEKDYETIMKYKKDDVIYFNFYTDALKRFYEIIPSKKYIKLSNDQDKIMENIEKNISEDKNIIISNLTSYKYENSHNFDLDKIVKKYFLYLTKYDIYKITHLIISSFRDHKIMETINLKYGKLNQDNISEIKNILEELLSPNNIYIQKMMQNKKYNKKDNEIIGEKLLKMIISLFDSRINIIFDILKMIINNFNDYYDGSSLDIDFLLSQKSNNVERDEIIYKKCIVKLMKYYKIKETYEDFIKFKSILRREFKNLKHFLEKQIIKKIFKKNDDDELNILNKYFTSMKINDDFRKIDIEEEEDIKKTNKIKIVKLNFIFNFVLSLASDEEKIMSLIEDEIDNYNYDVDFYKSLVNNPNLIIINLILNKKINTMMPKKSKETEESKETLLENIIISKFIKNIQSPIYEYITTRLINIFSDINNYIAELKILFGLPINIRNNIVQIKMIKEIHSDFNLTDIKSLNKLNEYYEEKEERMQYLKDLFFDKDNEKINEIKLEYMIKTIKDIKIRNYYASLIYDWKREYLSRIDKIMHLIRLT